MTFSKKEVIIFCQAPADVPYVLDLYIKLKGCDLIIFVINVYGVYEFISSLNLEVKLLKFINYNNVNYKSIISIFKEKIRVIKLKNHFFNDKENVDVYFFSRFEDWLTSSFLYHLYSKNNSIYYINHYDGSSDDHIELNTVKFTRKILGLVFYFISGVKFKMNIEFKFPEFPINKFNIVEQNPIVNNLVYDTFSIKFNFESNSRNKVLFFLSPPENELYDKVSYENVVIDAFTVLISNGFEIYIKGHPRSGLPYFIGTTRFEKFNIKIIDSYIPGEFIRLESFCLCLGIDSTVLSIISKKNSINTICLLDLVKPDNLPSFQYLKQYLINLSNNELLFIKSINGFDNYVKLI